jgi:opacity protein-like surface antigen
MLGGMRHTLLGFTLTLLAATSAFAQSDGTAVAITNTPVYVAPDASRTPLRTAAQGTVFTVLAEQGEWTQVQFKDPQWGIRVGFVATRALQFRRPELEPMDLSTTAADSAPPRHAPPPPHNITTTRMHDRPSLWPTFAAVGRGGFTFGTRVAPLAGAEFGARLAPMLMVYGSFDWHRDISPSWIGELEDLLNAAVDDLDVEVRTPAFLGMGGVKVMAPRGGIRPYALGGFGVARTKAKVEIDGIDVLDLALGLGELEEEDVRFTKPVFEVGGGVMFANGSSYADISYRFRKALDTGEPVNVSGIYAGVGVGF